MKAYIRTDNNQSITLVKEIASSGEGKVWQTNVNGYLAKIYHNRPNFEQVQKLKVMLVNPPKEPNAHLNHISFAWCKSLLRDTGGNCVGFLMPEVKNAKELIDIYNPQRRKILKLNLDWRFLHFTALNIASIIEAIHAKGYVLGDIKPQNILVNDRALPSIIDTDSFQVRHPQNGRIYRCLVGSEGFTPPELIGKDFATTNQTEVHDHFRLAMIIYHLLFGDSPFSGAWKGVGEIPQPSEIIRQGYWLYKQNSLIKPVPRTISFYVVHKELQRYFIRCFSDGHRNPNLRPSAREWVSALKLAVNELTLCRKVDSHYYMRSVGKCYWCDRASHLGVDIFPATGKPKPQSKVTVPKTLTVPTSKSKVFAATNTLELINQVGNEITVVGEVVSTSYIDNSQKTLFINFSRFSTSINGYTSFQIVISSDGLFYLFLLKNITVDQMQNWKGKYIKVTGVVKIKQKVSVKAPQIIVNGENQINVISKAEANILLTASFKKKPNETQAMLKSMNLSNGSKIKELLISIINNFFHKVSLKIEELPRWVLIIYLICISCSCLFLIDILIFLLFNRHIINEKIYKVNSFIFGFTLAYCSVYYWIKLNNKND